MDQSTLHSAFLLEPCQLFYDVTTCSFTLAIGAQVITCCRTFEEALDKAFQTFEAKHRHCSKITVDTIDLVGNATTQCAQTQTHK